VFECLRPWCSAETLVECVTARPWVSLLTLHPAEEAAVAPKEHPRGRTLRVVHLGRSTCHAISGRGDYSQTHQETLRFGVWL